jgi:geranylgeranyl pyrophosphate synthase
MTTSPSEHWQTDARQTIDQALRQCLDQVPPSRLRDAMHYSIAAGGKCLRPMLCLATCGMFHQPQETALVPACAIELLHTYSLIHDDLPAMDNDDLRRGKPSCHKAFDDATAILAGDALQALAFELLSTDGDFTDKQRLIMLRTLAQAAGPSGMVAGQMQDILAEGKTLNIAELTEIHRLKTGRLIQASLLLGLQAAGITEGGTLAKMEQLGALVGLAFQVQDDILDVIGDTDQLGKQKGADAALNKSTFPALLGLKESQRYVLQLHQQAQTRLDDFGKEAFPLRSLVDIAIHRTF